MAVAARKSGRQRDRVELPAILHALADEHKYQLRLLKLLEKQVATLNLKQEPDYPVMHGVMRYMTQYPDRFHHPKEDLVFEKVVERSPSSKPEVDALLRAHERIIAQGTQLLELIDRCSAEPEKADRLKLRKSTHAYIGQLRRHMDIEMLRIFPRAQQVLRAADWAEVDARMKPILDPVFSESVAPEFQTLRALDDHRPEPVSPGALHRGLVEAAAMIESASAMLAGATKVNARLARHHREVVSANVATVRSLLKPQPLGRRAELVGKALAKNFTMARDINRRVSDAWSDALQAARRPYQDEGPYAAKLFRALSKPRR
jgi:hemerythrin-like domain-containing protein